MIKRLLIALLLAQASLSVSSIVPAWPESPKHTLDEAIYFFNQIAKTYQNPLIVQLAQENLRRLKAIKPVYRGESHQVTIPIATRFNNTVVVTATVNHRIQTNFVIDTGATYTMITPALYEKLGLPDLKDLPRINIATANGVVRVPMATLPNVKVGTLQINNVEALIQDLGNPSTIAGLLGMNFFNHMDVTLKSDKVLLEIPPAE